MINLSAQLGYSCGMISLTTNSQYGSSYGPNLLSVDNGDGNNQYLSGQKYNKYSYNDQGSIAKPEVLFPIDNDPAYIDVSLRPLMRLVPYTSNHTIKPLLIETPLQRKCRSTQEMAVLAPTYPVISRQPSLFQKNR